MKLKSVAALCKKEKCIFLFDIPGERESVTQWVGDGYAIYPINNIPYLETEGICTIFELNEKQKEDFLIRHNGKPEGIDFNDVSDGETMLEGEKISFNYAGRSLKPLQTSRGLVFIENKHLAPLADIAGFYELYERHTPSGGTYIAVKTGFMLVAIVLTYDAISENFVKLLETTARKCRIELDRREAARAEAERNGPQQQSLIFGGKAVDPDTGEVIDETEGTEE